MRIAVIGGGPGGLYFALLAKKGLPDAQIDVYEQNRADDTFGFGVVFSDETLDEFLSADPQSYDLVREKFAYWSDIVIEHEGRRTIVGGNGFAGCSRKGLLEILQRRCREVGVGLHFETVIDAASYERRFAGCDLVVVAQGINSPIRQRHEREFGVSIVEQRNKFAWLGSTRPLDAFTFFFRMTPHGPFCAHTYQYEEGRSTWVMETTPECWAASGLANMSEAESAAYLERVFADDLKGHSLLTNRSIWRSFPTISCARWSVGATVLLGDAKATAHWSIGSGTKLAMECAIALAKAVVRSPRDIAAALADYEKERRTPVEVTQHNAQVSLKWFEDMPVHWGKAPMAFAFSLMSRGKSVTWDNLKLRDAGFLDRVEQEFYRTYEARTGRRVAAARPTPMFTPIDLRGLTVPNRVAMAPMAQYSAEQGDLTDWHFAHYAARALGGAGLIFTEMTCPAPDARITPACAGLWSDRHESQWAELVKFVHGATPSKIALQLGHAGRKGSTRVPAEGEDKPLPHDNWPLISASPLPYLDGISDIPGEMTRADMDRVIAEFAAAARRGARAGFDMLELHCAHGYLLASFLSPLTNRRADDYGGRAADRARFPVEVFAAIRAAFPADRPISVRLSCSDWAEGGLTLDDLKVVAGAFKDAGADIIHCSSGQTVPWQKPVYGRMWQTPFAEFVKNAVGVPTIAVGDITLPEQVNTIIAAARADLCALARPHLNNPFFTRQAAGHYGVKAAARDWPAQLKSGEHQLFREAEKANEKSRELALKARPNRRHYSRAD
ncbi:MAG: bifunctional salicylyl-CoA 5-hydroxylase/oxidoreductase [Parvularculaceae bacterium]|nr:bifunctional salicylyl-CoA 5-hydroxylase/oxidoreductase [Parvularculaceae bacterium]